MALFSITAASGVLCVIMGLAGPNTNVLFGAWIFAPAPIVVVLLILRKFSLKLQKVAIGYVGMSVLSSVLLLGAVGWTGSQTALHPEPCEGMDNLSDYPYLELGIEKVSLNASDGTRLEGWLARGSSEAAVILLHGYRCDKRSMLLRANMLYQSGMTVFLFDFRNSGESEGEFTSFGYYERLDLAAAVAFLQDQQTVTNNQVPTRGPIGILGLSNGGATAILYAAENPGMVDALVIDSAFKSLDSAVSQSFTHFVGLPAFPFAPITVWITEMRTGISRKAIMPEKSVQRLQDVPILVIHGITDNIISFKDSEAIYQGAPEPKELWLVPESEHGNASEIAGPEYRGRTVEFFKRHLLD